MGINIYDGAATFNGGNISMNIVVGFETYSYAIDGYYSDINITGGIVGAKSGDAKYESSALNSLTGNITNFGNAQVYTTFGNVVNDETSSIAINGKNVYIFGSCYIEAVCGTAVFTGIAGQNLYTNNCMSIGAEISRTIANNSGIIKFGNSAFDYSEKTIDDITADDIDNAKFKHWC